MQFGVREPNANQLQVPLWRSDSSFGFLLKAVQHVDEALEPSRVDIPVGIPAIVRDDLNRVQTPHGACRRVELAKFRLIERLTDLKTNGLRKFAQLFPGVAHHI